MIENNKDLKIKALLTELHNIKKNFAIKLEEIQTLYMEIKQQRNLNEDHQKLNGKLRIELQETKTDNKKLAKQIEDLKKEAKEMLQYP